MRGIVLVLDAMRRSSEVSEVSPNARDPGHPAGVGVTFIALGFHKHSAK